MPKHSVPTVQDKYFQLLSVISQNHSDWHQMMDNVAWRYSTSTIWKKNILCIKTSQLFLQIQHHYVHNLFDIKWLAEYLYGDVIFFIHPLARTAQCGIWLIFSIEIAFYYNILYSWNAMTSVVYLDKSSITDDTRHHPPLPTIILMPAQFYLFSTISNHNTLSLLLWFILQLPEMVASHKSDSRHDS